MRQQHTCVGNQGLPTTIPTHSPWGAVEDHTIFAPGIVMVSTRDHGGIHLDDWRQAQVPAEVRSPDAWYEEDCKWSIPAVLFANELDPSIVDQANIILKGWKPQSYEIVMRARSVSC